MPPKAAPKEDSPLVLLMGDDDFASTARAKELYKGWCEASGGMDHEIIDATAANVGEASSAVNRLRESLQTLPFFGGTKVVWFRNCNFLADDRTSNSSEVTANLAALAAWMKEFDWKGVKLLISAREVDKRRSFYKTLEKVGSIEEFKGMSLDTKDWDATMELAARRGLKEWHLEIGEEAIGLLVGFIGPNMRSLQSEIEKLGLYCTSQGRKEVTIEDVETVVSRNKQAKAFAVADALGRRQLPELMRKLDQELWSMHTDKDKSEIGLLYGFISKVRTMLLAKELVREGYVKAGAAYPQFKAQLERIPPDAMPQDKKFNPLGMHPFMLYNSYAQSQNYSSEELVQAMQVLLDCNLKLVSSSTDEAALLQQALVKIAQPREGTR